jgi:FkbM family methyltransferase
MMLHSGLRNLHNMLEPVIPPPIMRWAEERYLLRFGEPEIGLLEFLCQPARDALDIGGNEGCYSLVLRKYARFVVAFEPIPWMAGELRRKFGVNISVHDIALSSSAGTAILHIPIIDGKLESALATLSETPFTRQLAKHSIVVNTARLDDVYGGDVGFIKIDVEGHEEAVLEGACSTIARNRPRLLIEIEERHAPGALARIVQFFTDREYLGYFFDRGRLRPLSHFDHSVMQRPEATVGVGAVYINNFIFLPAEDAGQVVSRISTALNRTPSSDQTARVLLPGNPPRQLH